MADYNNDIFIAKKIAEKVSEYNGSTYYVGGFVRDELLNKSNKDIDIEIHGITPSAAEEILDSVGTRIAIGESFGIYNLAGYTIDIAMPRKETAIGTGHKDFDIFVDPFIGTYNAAKRRDFTINALMKNVLTDEIIDHFGGKKDLKDGIIRHIDNTTFIEDPLRVLRAAQFAARFGFYIADETTELCQGIPLDNLSKERIESELCKALLKAEKPSIFFEALRKMNKLDEWFPELKALSDIRQNPRYHKEGDVWTHTMMVIDAAAKYRDKVEYPEGFMVSAIVHDFGKAVCTEEVNSVIHSYNHEKEGVAVAKQFLNRITSSKRLKKYVLNMVEMHMAPNVIANNQSSVKASNRMFDKSVNPQDLIYLAAADDEGRISESTASTNTEFLLSRYEIFKEIMNRPYVTGSDLIEAGLKPDNNFTQILQYAHKLRLAGIEKKSALKQTISYAKKLK
ncbi:MAG: HD domain-containing protein [Clostridia bacterium]|nr:HD domain-containing protein [Clostridia bacterium]